MSWFHICLELKDVQYDEPEWCHTLEAVYERTLDSVRLKEIMKVLRH